MKELSMDFLRTIKQVGGKPRIVPTQIAARIVDFIGTCIA